MSAAQQLPAVDLEMTGDRRFSPVNQERPYVLYCYPKDMTSGCTLEGQEFSRLKPKFAELGFDIFGLSPDPVASHEKFLQKCSLSVALVSDPEHRLLVPLGVWVQKSMYGRSYMGVQRSTFLVTKDGSIQKEWRDVKAAGHAAAVLQEIASVQR